MKKKLRVVALVALGLGLAVYFGLGYFLGFVVRTAVNRAAPRIMQTRAELAHARISPVSGSGVLTGLAVANPPGWSDRNAFYLGRIYVKLKPFSLFGDHIVIEEINIDEPEFRYETGVLSSNINDLLKNIAAAKGAKPGTDATTADGRVVRFEVRHLRLTRGKITLGVGAAEMTLPLAPIELRDLGTGDGGITPAQLTFAVVKSVSGEIVGATAHAAGQIGATAGAAALEGVRKTGEEIKKLLGGK